MATDGLVLETHGLSKTYKDVRALQDFTLTLKSPNPNTLTEKEQEICIINQKGENWNRASKPRLPSMLRTLKPK